MPLINVSNGELLDRLSILDIKRERLLNPSQKMFVENEFNDLDILSRDLLSIPTVAELYEKIRMVNLQMWEAMQKIYDWESLVDDHYVTTVLDIIEVNKERARVKKSIDEETNSVMREAKSFFESGVDD